MSAPIWAAAWLDHALGTERPQPPNLRQTGKQGEFLYGSSHWDHPSRVLPVCISGKNKKKMQVGVLGKRNGNFSVSPTKNTQINEETSEIAAANRI